MFSYLSESIKICEDKRSMYFFLTLTQVLTQVSIFRQSQTPHQKPLGQL